MSNVSESSGGESGSSPACLNASRLYAITGFDALNGSEWSVPSNR